VAQAIVEVSIVSIAGARVGRGTMEVNGRTKRVHECNREMVESESCEEHDSSGGWWSLGTQ